MLVPQLLLETLEDLINDDFEKLKWFLTLGAVEGYKAIPTSHLQKQTNRMDTVTKIVKTYGEEPAVDVTIKVLRKMNFNALAEELESKHAAGKQVAPDTSSSAAAPPPAAAAPPAAPGAISAHQGSVVFAPTIVGGTAGAWNVTINK